jgi:hypothetical protein
MHFWVWRVHFEARSGSGVYTSVRRAVRGAKAALDSYEGLADRGSATTRASIAAVARAGGPRRTDCLDSLPGGG